MSRVSLERLDQISDDGGTTAYQRFEYQTCYGALLLLGLLNDPAAVLHCERLEDFSLEDGLGHFRCIQVTSRRPDMMPFKALDQKVIKSLKRFCKLEAELGDKIKAYVIAASCGFLPSASSIGLRELIAKRRNLDSESWLADAACATFSAKTSSDPRCLGNVLLKLEAATEASLDDIEARLFMTVAQYRNDLPGGQVAAVCNGLMDCVRRASAARTSLGNRTYIAAAVGNDKIRAKLRANKSLTREHLDAIIAAGQESPSSSLTFRIQRDLPNLTRKLNAAGTPQVEIDALKEQTYLAEYATRDQQLLSTPERARYRDQVLRTRADSLYRRVYQTLITSGQPFSGHDIFKELEDAVLQDTISARIENIAPYTFEELMGHAGQLANDCKHSWETT